MSRARGPIETPEYAQMIRRLIKRYGERVADADEVDLAEMLSIAKLFDDTITAAVHGQRTLYGRSWLDIGKGAGITKQGAFRRWGRKVEELDHQLAADQQAAFEVIAERDVTVRAS